LSFTLEDIPLDDHGHKADASEPTSIPVEVSIEPSMINHKERVELSEASIKVWRELNLLDTLSNPVNC
jgi:hypothetical protein